MKTWILLFWLVILGGCAATNPNLWGPSPEDPTLKRAVYECQEEMDNRLRWAAGFGGVVVPIAAAINAPGKFDQCMESRGFQKAP